MKSRTLGIISMALFAALVPTRLAPQEQQDDREHMRGHHHYKLIDMGTFGGPQSYVNDGAGGAYAVVVVNNDGVAAGWADESAPDPYPKFCFDADCFVAHAFKWRNGVRTDLGLLLGGASTQANWISPNGLVAGVAQNGEIDPLVPGFPELRAVLWHNDVITDLGTLEGGYESAAQAVNSRGQVVGISTNTVPDAYSMFGNGYQGRAFSWQDGVMQDLGTLGTGTDAQALLVNKRGQVVGWSYTNSSPGACGLGLALTTGSFVWDKERRMVDLGGFGGTCTLATDLNDRGQIVGGSNLAGDHSERAFLWENGSLHDLGGSFGGNFAGASAINEAGQAVGFGYFPGDVTFHAAFWPQVGTMTDLGIVRDGDCSFASSINAKTQVVGEESPCNAPGAAAFLWEHGSIVNLNTLIPPGSPLDLQFTFTINDRGEIAGEGVDMNGNNHAFLLIPCDEEHRGEEGCVYGMADSITAAEKRTTQMVARGHRHIVGRIGMQHDYRPRFYGGLGGRKQ